MSAIRAQALGVSLIFSLGACNTLPPHESRLLHSEVDLKDTVLVSVVPSNELTVRRDFVEGNSPIPAFVCPVCTLALAMADKSSQEKAQAAEDRVLLPKLLSELGEWRTRDVWQAGLPGSVTKGKNIHVSRIEVIDRQTSADDFQIKPEERINRPFTLLELDHHLSANLDKFRMQLRARVFDEKGNSVAEQYYYFLPVPVQGATKNEAINDWKANTGSTYRKTSEVGVKGILEALQLTLFSSQSQVDGGSDASTLLARRNCYAGDYEAGIPLAAYNKGTLIASREDYSIVRLANNDVLVVATCDR